MKSIKQQYIDLTEGRMSQANFMRSVRMTIPQYITNITSFGDTVKILKNKGILSESYRGNDEWIEGFKDALSDVGINYPGMNAQEMISKYGDLTPAQAVAKWREDIPNVDWPNEPEDDGLPFEGMNPDSSTEESNEDAEFDAILKQLEDQMAGEEAVKAQYDETLNEAKEPNVEKDEDENLEEVTLGITTEHECFPAKSYDEIEKMVKKNIKKNPLYYTNYKLTGIRDYKVQTMDSSKPEDHQMKFYTEKTAVDTARGMKKIKVEKKKLKEQVEEAMPFKDLPANPEVYKTVKDMKGKIIKATNADGIEFQRGDVVKAFDGEEIKITDFKEEQGKIKALYNKGMFFATIDIDGLKAPKPDYMPGVNIGKSFEKFKMKDLKEMIRQAMDEFYDGRDNLTNISDDTK